MHQQRQRFLRKKASVAKSKRFLTRLHARRLKRSFDKFRASAAKQPKKTKNRVMVLERKFLPCLDRYAKRVAFQRWAAFRAAAAQRTGKRKSLLRGDSRVLEGPQRQHFTEVEETGGEMNYENILDQFGQLKNELGLQLDEQIQQESEEVGGAVAEKWLLEAKARAADGDGPVRGAGVAGVVVRVVPDRDAAAAALHQVPEEGATEDAEQSGVHLPQQPEVQ